VPRAALRPAEIAAFRARAAAAAARLFAAQGYEAVTMRAVGEALGVSAMTPYRYLAGKDELFALVRTEAYRRFADRLEAALAGGGDPLARLRRLKRAYVEFALHDPDSYRVMFELRQPDPDGVPELAAQSRRAFGCLHRTVADAVEARRLTGDPLTLAHLLWAGTHGLVSLALAGKLAMGRSLEELAALDFELAAVRASAPAATRTTRRRRAARNRRTA
jgi:AcrR family transcriptional regulator